MNVPRSLPAPIAAAPAPAPAGLRPYLSLAIAFALAAGAEAFTSSAVSLALPRIAADFSSSPDEIGWAITLYLTAYALALPLTAWLSDTLGQKRFLGLSMTIYAAASLGCIASSSLAVFLAWRVVQGAAGAAFVARAIFTFTKELRPPVLTKALMIFICGFSLKALGLPFGGLLVDQGSWRWLFAVPVVVMTLGALPALVVSEERWPRRSRRSPDFAGLGLLALGLAALFGVLLRGERDEWFSSRAIVTLALLAAVALPGFVWRQMRRKGDDHILPLTVLAYRGMSVGVGLSFLAGVMMIGGLYVLPRFFLQIVHTDACRAGWLMSLDAWALMGGLALAAWTLGKLMTRSLLVLSGLAFTGSMLWLALRVTSDTPVEALYLPIVLHGVAVGLALPPIGIFSFRAIGTHHAHNGEGRAWHYTARQIGGAVALALALVVLDGRATVHSGRLAENLTPVDSAATHTLTTIARGLVRHGLAPTAAAPAARLVLSRIVRREATVLAFRDLFFLTAAFGLVVSALAFGLPRLRRPGRAKNGPAAFPAPPFPFAEKLETQIPLP